MYSQQELCLGAGSGNLAVVTVTSPPPLPSLLFIESDVITLVTVVFVQVSNQRGAYFSVIISD